MEVAKRWRRAGGRQPEASRSVASGERAQRQSAPSLLCLCDAFGCAVIGAKHHRSKLQRSTDGKLRTDVVQEFLSELEGRCLDDRSCEIVSPRDRHVATVRDGAQQIARAIFHHW